MAYRYFISTAWGGTGTPASLPPVYDDDENLIAAYYYTLDQAINAAVAGDNVCPAPPNTPGCAFLDAFGKPLKTVVVPLGASLTKSEPITIEGGAYRLRLDGGWSKYFVFYNQNYPDAIYANDVDFVNLTEFYCRGVSWLFTRCRFVANSVGFYRRVGYVFNLLEESIVICKTGSWDGASLKRSTMYGAPRGYGNAGDNVIDATGAAFAASKGAVADVTDWRDWETTCDLHLADGSSYATGNSLTSADGAVYDLYGNKRKTGGALGAYEVLSEVTKTALAQEPGYCYVVTKGNANAPDVDSIALYDVGQARSLLCAGKYSGATKVCFSSDGVGYSTARIVAADGYDSRNKSNSNAFMKLTNANGDETIVRFYAPDDTASSDAIPCAADFDHPKTWAEDAAPSSSDVCYIGTNDNFVSASSDGVSKIIVPGWTRPNLGNVPAVDPEIGLNSVVTTRGAITLTNRTSTSAEILAPFDPRSGAAFTFQNCAVSDADDA